MLASTCAFAEVSVFGAGDLKSDNPYGLSESEKVVFANKKATLENRRQIKALKVKIDDMQESLEGLRSVVDSLSEKVGKTGAKLHALDTRPQNDTTTEISALKEEIAAQKAQNEKILKALRKLTMMVESINSDYVSQSELAGLKKKVKSKPTPRKSVSKSNKAVLKDAIKYYRAKKYQKAIPLFEKLVEQNYKRATSSYYLGEIAYYQKRYADAIDYFKQSASLYDKASYMPTLLLHTALSFKKLGDAENAKRFFEAIVATYPGTAQAKMAQKYL